MSDKRADAEPPADAAREAAAAAQEALDTTRKAAEKAKEAAEKAQDVAEKVERAPDMGDKAGSPPGSDRDDAVAAFDSDGDEGAGEGDF